jgi:hypothetical protein
VAGDKGDTEGALVRTDGLGWPVGDTGGNDTFGGAVGGAVNGEEVGGADGGAVRGAVEVGGDVIGLGVVGPVGAMVTAGQYRGFGPPSSLYQAQASNKQ